MSETQDAYHELYAYTMGRPGFILQHVVDAHHAQNAPASGTPPIGIVFALVGLYLLVEKGFSGSQVQQAHRKLGARKRDWPAMMLPASRGRITAADVMNAPAGPARDLAIRQWCESVWAEFQENRDTVIRLLQEFKII